MYPAAGVAARVKTPSGSTAETLILIGLILQAIITLASLGALFGLGGLLFFSFGGALLFVVGIPFLLLALFFLYAAFEWSYNRTRAGDYEGARTWTLILGILGLPFGWVIVGILYIIAYVKLGDAANEQRQASMMPPGGAPTYPGTPVYSAPAPAPVAVAPVAPAAPVAAAAPPCPRCGQPGTWIAQYSRYYCYRDQQYL